MLLLSTTYAARRWCQYLWLSKKIHLCLLFSRGEEKIEKNPTYICIRAEILFAPDFVGETNLSTTLCHFVSSALPQYSISIAIEKVAHVHPLLQESAVRWHQFCIRVFAKEERPDLAAFYSRANKWMLVRILLGEGRLVLVLSQIL